MMASLICTAWACVSGRGIKTGICRKTAKEDWFKIIQRRTKNGKFEIKEINIGSCG